MAIRSTEITVLLKVARELQADFIESQTDVLTPFRVVEYTHLMGQLNTLAKVIETTGIRNVQLEEIILNMVAMAGSPNSINSLLMDCLSETERKEGGMDHIDFLMQRMSLQSGLQLVANALRSMRLIKAKAA
jgi:hypothetical protein